MALIFSPASVSAETVTYAESFIMEETKGPVQYASGGVGINEREAMLVTADKYNLRLSFATGKGAYLANIMVVVKDKAGNVLIHTASHGPWFFAKLPEGSYQIMAAHNQVQRMNHITLADARQKILFHWK